MKRLATTCSHAQRKLKEGNNQKVTKPATSQGIGKSYRLCIFPLPISQSIVITEQCNEPSSHKSTSMNSICVRETQSNHNHQIMPPVTERNFMRQSLNRIMHGIKMNGKRHYTLLS